MAVNSLFPLPDRCLDVPVGVRLVLADHEVVLQASELTRPAGLVRKRETEGHAHSVSRHPANAVYDVQTLSAIVDVARKISLALTILLIVIAAIALLISGIGIMNIMLVTVTERTHEIGIRKAIGAARREILYQFLVESFFISGGGAVIGILVGIAVPVVVQYFWLPPNLRVPISNLSVVIAFVVSCSTGLLFGYLPASRAANLQPVESLRYE